MSTGLTPTISFVVSQQEPTSGPSTVEITMLNVVVSFCRSEQTNADREGSGSGLNEAAVEKLLPAALTEALWAAECSRTESVEERQQQLQQQPPDDYHKTARALLLAFWQADSGHQSQVRAYVSSKPPNIPAAAATEGGGSTTSPNVARTSTSGEKASDMDCPSSRAAGGSPGRSRRARSPELHGQEGESSKAKRARAGPAEGTTPQIFEFRFVEKFVMPSPEDLRSAKTCPLDPSCQSSGGVEVPTGSTPAGEIDPRQLGLRVLDSTGAFDVAFALKWMCARAVNVVVCDGDGLDSAAAAKSATEFLQGISVNRPEAVDTETKILWLGHDVGVPESFTPVKTLLQVRVRGTLDRAVGSSVLFWLCVPHHIVIFYVHTEIRLT